EDEGAHDNMSSVSVDRSIRLQDIKKGLQFIHKAPLVKLQNNLCDLTEDLCFQIFIRELVKNLFNEGNDAYREGDWEGSLNHYSEALNIADYANSEGIHISDEILEKLHVNRIACYSKKGSHDRVLEECGIVLKLNENNFRALYRRSKALKELGRYKEAYDAVAKCSLAVPQDENVIKLTQELAQKLGLKIRKAYVRAKVSENSCVLLISAKSSLPQPISLSDFSSWAEKILSSSSTSSSSSSFAPELPSDLPPLAAVSRMALPAEKTACSAPSLANGGPFSIPDGCLDCEDGDDIIGDELDELLDSVSDPGDGGMVSALALGNVAGGGAAFSSRASHKLSGPFSVPLSFGEGERKSSGLEKNGTSVVTSLLFPLDPKSLEYTYHLNLEHICKKDILIGRIKNSEDKFWKKIRPRPTKTQYVGPYYICKDVAAGEECRYSGHCTFAYCQEEIDVWTLERKGAFSREALFEGSGEISLTVSRLLQEHHGLFMFLCEKCFEHKPRIISKRNKDNSSSCSHPAMHDFEENKCLVHILRETTVKYSKIRPFHPQGQLDLCRHEARYGCSRDDECFYAHSLVELQVWMMQSKTGITQEAIVQESKKYWQNLDSTTHGAQILSNQVKHGSLNLKMKFVCAQCWRNGQVSEPDKNRKYCSAKARHPWTRDRRVMLVMSNERRKWNTIRPLPAKKQAPLQFDLCNHIASGKKCLYVGNCSFAHSQEEREMWTYMKENGIQDMEQLYEMWLKSQKPEKGEDPAPQANKENGKQIHMPTDYAEVTVDFHCWMCGKNCNSEKQWQGHISSEKHKEKVFHTEDDQNRWQHRFPTGYFSICDRFMAGSCIEGNNCKFAHGPAELGEWEERRHVLRMKFNKARKDHLIAPNDNDFGKYSFLFKDLN
uniref:Zinc finger CCCH-type containing 7A n=1 Tax=Pseudonaja textilis TaxID=8673 RepID=A0A670Z9R4_PSETE